MEEPQGLRARKKQRTRAALIDAAYRLFDSRGYSDTTVNQIAAAAEVSPATFFNHFASKEDVIFADGGVLLEEISQRLESLAAGRNPVEALADAVRATTADAGTRAPGGELEAIRIRLITTEPALQAPTLRRTFDSQHGIAAALHRAYAATLGHREAEVLVGAVVGAIFAAVHSASRAGEPLDRALDDTLDILTRTWRPAARRGTRESAR
ncbi:MAG TPA: TetR/AcrR family transcriptional regulator [Stackebrandtia sp.]|jgi:AcrR family transcriptional regulator|uniref:TetR/AcrR family transcriptional regulator n=1 Tax=Stackebrandtia sp. TaxID=2023065 RepID=UPI002D497C5E|nr:TetR/AcrR family transcriptional regulator [Stackebrandtia sp.]HZE37618.1 TetR/AcrR family transcriptional regulator [Stackebrandtia sp.]